MVYCTVLRRRRRKLLFGFLIKNEGLTYSTFIPTSSGRLNTQYFRAREIFVEGCRVGSVRTGVLVLSVGVVVQDPCSL